MRGAICLAAGLLLTNIVLVQVHAPPKPRPKPEAKPIVVESVLPNAQTATDAQRLMWLWHAKHAAFAAPACLSDDPLAVLDADVDPTPGREHLIGNRRFGVAMYDAQGALLAHMDPIGCGSLFSGDQSLSLHFDGHLTIRVSEQYDQGSATMVHIVERNDNELRELLRTELDLRSESEYHVRDVEGKLHFLGNDEIEIIHHGRQRDLPAGAWEAVDDHCTWNLVTRTSSCRIRAGARK